LFSTLPKIEACQGHSFRDETLIPPLISSLVASPQSICDEFKAKEEKNIKMKENFVILIEIVQFNGIGRLKLKVFNFLHESLSETKIGNQIF
jgi:hypothetical protein